MLTITRCGESIIFTFRSMYDQDLIVHEESFDIPTVIEMIGDLLEKVK